MSKKMVETKKSMLRGEFLPLSVWKARGWDSNMIKNNATDSDFEEHPKHGPMYRVKVHTTEEGKLEEQCREQVLALMTPKKEGRSSCDRSGGDSDCSGNTTSDNSSSSSRSRRKRTKKHKKKKSRKHHDKKKKRTSRSRRTRKHSDTDSDTDSEQTLHLGKRHKRSRSDSVKNEREATKLRRAKERKEELQRKEEERERKEEERRQEKEREAAAKQKEGRNGFVVLEGALQGLPDQSEAREQHREEGSADGTETHRPRGEKVVGATPWHGERGEGALGWGYNA